MRESVREKVRGRMVERDSVRIRDNVSKRDSLRIRDSEREREIVWDSKVERV